MRRAPRRLALLGVLVAAIAALVGLTAAPASAHVLPSTAVVLDVGSDSIDASLRIPTSDLVAASGIALDDNGSAGDADASASVAAHADEVRAYILAHFRPTSTSGATSGQDWTVAVGELGAGSTEELGTGVYGYVTAAVHLVPPAGGDLRSFALGYDVVVHQVVTHVVIVSVRSDWATGTLGSARELGTIRLDTVSGTVTPLQVDLGAGNAWAGFASMVALGVDHIREGVDHQLFLLTLLLPAPLVAGRAIRMHGAGSRELQGVEPRPGSRPRRRGLRWSGVAPPRRAVRRIAAVTLSFTVGHSITLALGALGLPVPQQAVEALIAASVLVAAVHAVRPLFPGKEALVAGLFGLVHGLAFSATLSELGLSGGQLALSLLGFNLGIELMQLAVVALVLPALVLLARTRIYPPLRVGAAVLAGVAALGWLAARLGVPNAVAQAADGLGAATPFVLGALWLAAAGAAVVMLMTRREPIGAASGRA